MFVCLNDDFPCVYSIMNASTEECQYCHAKSSDCIKYSYLPLADKVICWCSDEHFCKKVTAHWRDNDTLLNAEEQCVSKCEIWDGNRFCELSWFGTQKRGGFYLPGVQ